MTISNRQHQTIVILPRSHIISPIENDLTTLFSNVSDNEETNKQTHPLTVFFFVYVSQGCVLRVYVTMLLSISAYDVDSIYSFESL